MLIGAVYIGGMDAPLVQYVSILDPNIAQRHNVSEWWNKLFLMVMYNNETQLLEFLSSAGDDAKPLVSSHVSKYGTILDTAYMESTNEIKKIILRYMNDESLMHCFNKRKAELHSMWQYNASQMDLQKKTSNESILRVKPSIDLLMIPLDVDLSRVSSAEAIVRDLYQKDSARFLLTPYEREKLGIKK